MLVSDFVKLSAHFKPYYNLEDENTDYWKQYISNPQFEELVSRFLDMLYPRQREAALSIWLHGSYGTGKSHCVGVIKQLLSAPVEDVREYIEEQIKDASLKNRLLTRKWGNPIFPVVLKGSRSIYNNITFLAEIQSAVSSALKARDIQIATPTEFETFATTIENDPSNAWELRIENWLCLSEHGICNRQDIVKRLRDDADIDLLLDIKQQLEQENQLWPMRSITQWLIDVMRCLREQNIADRLVLFWDEFTSIMNLHNESIISLIQDIAELTPDHGIYLFLISHRSKGQFQSKSSSEKRSVDKVLDRFESFPIEMQEITTYHLLANAIKHEDEILWKQARDIHYDSLKHVIDQLESLSEEMKGMLLSAFPLHPFTAYIANFVAREIGSTERSVFKFLYDPESGFKQFIEQCQDTEKMLCTADYVFRFFFRDFKDRQEEHIQNILTKYRLHNSTLERYNRDYPRIFEGLLLLNIVHRLLNTTEVQHRRLIPTRQNVELMFRGSHIDSSVSGFFELLEEKNNILTRDYEGRYLVESSILDSGAVAEHKNRLECKYHEVTDILSAELQQYLFSEWKEHQQLRRRNVCTIELIDASNTEQQVKRSIRKLQNKPGYQLKILVFLSSNGLSIDNAKRVINFLAEDSNATQYKNIVYITIEQELYSELEFGRFIDFKARLEVAQQRKLLEEAENYTAQSRNEVESWITRIKKEYLVEWYLIDDTKQLQSGRSTFANTPIVLNNTLSPKIFHRSPEVVTDQLNNLALWKEQHAKSLLHSFLDSMSLTNLRTALKSIDKQTLDIFLTNDGTQIVKESLQFTGKFEHHPLYIIREQMRNHLKKGEEFNLADSFAFLFKPPYGFYKCKVYYAIAGFFFQHYVGKLYRADKGVKCTAAILEDCIVKVFQVHCDNKANAKNDLNMRLGSEEETKLRDLLNRIFDLGITDSFTATRYKMMDWFKENHPYPLWLYEYSTTISEDVQESLLIMDQYIFDRDMQENYLTPDEMTQLFNELGKYEQNLCRLFNVVQEDTLSRGMDAFVQQQLQREMSEDELQDAKQEIMKRAQGDQYRLHKEQVEQYLKDWELERLRRNANDPNGPNHPLPPQTPTPTNPKRFESLKSTIRQTNKELRNVLLMLLEARPDIHSDLERILEQED